MGYQFVCNECGKFLGRGFYVSSGDYPHCNGCMESREFSKETLKIAKELFLKEEKREMDNSVTIKERFDYCIRAEKKLKRLKAKRK